MFLSSFTSQQLLEDNNEGSFVGARCVVTKELYCIFA